VNVLPTVLPWLTTVSTIPAIGFGIEILRKSRNFQRRVSRLFQVAKESIEQEKQKLAADKDKKIQSEIDRQNSEQQRKIEKLKDQIQRQKQRIGLTGKYKSLLDFVNTRLDDNSYQKLLGLMHQIQDDLADLSDHLTYKPEKINNPDKLEVLKVHFPRGPARIVLYIDDLDRCPPDKVVEVLEAVQLLLNTEIFIIVLAIDDRYIGRALEQVYEGVLKRGATPSGIDYLEKIIQIPYRMRPINKDMTEKFLRSLIDIEDKPQEDQPQKEKITIWEDNSEKGNMELSTYSDKISEPINEENYNKENDSEKTPSSENQTSLVDFQKVTSQKFTSEEVQWISECCKCVDLNPRTTKRLINICKILKNIWTPGPNDRIWKEEPEEKYKRTLIAFLALAGRYPQEMRKLLEEIYLEFEETNINTVKIIKYKWLNRLQNLDPLMDTHNQREWKKFKNDLNKMPPQEFVFDKRTFNLAVSFCFVGDLGYDPDDTYNREYKFEDPQKQYGFKRI
jgi:predicted KAP-like P-loop ATPase